MNDVEPASVSRSLIAVAMLVFGSLIFFYVWQSSDDVLPHSVLIVVSVAIIAWAFWRYRGSRTRRAAPTSTIPPANNFDSLVERHRETIATYKDRIGLRAWYDDNVTDVVRDCIRNIAEKEGRTDIWPPQYGGYGTKSLIDLSEWEQRTNIPAEYRRLAAHLKTDFQERADELRRSKDEEVAARAEKMLTANRDLVEEFLDITERKVSVLDDYGDEQWDALPKEIIKFLKKLNERERLTVIVEAYLPKEYRLIGGRLQQLFQNHHQLVKSKRDETDLESLSGVEFEAHIARLLHSAGYDVQGTRTTGDQGGDLIARKDGRTIIIQAKRYQGTVGNKAVQEVISAVSFYGGDEGWVVTNSTFTPSAIALAQKANINIKLIDGTALKTKSVL